MAKLNLIPFILLLFSTSNAHAFWPDGNCMPPSESWNKELSCSVGPSNSFLGRDDVTQIDMIIYRNHKTAERRLCGELTVQICYSAGPEGTFPVCHVSTEHKNLQVRKLQISSLGLDFSLRGQISSLKISSKLRHGLRPISVTLQTKKVLKGYCSSSGR